jgi:molecular chaperone HtpG
MTVIYVALGQLLCLGLQPSVTNLLEQRVSEPALTSLAERRALAATRYEGFGVSLPEIKRTVSELLSQIGRHGFFAEYSKHDISHIDEVIRLAEWLVDDGTKKFMTDADWFLLTLSIYFHDLGMLVTKDEYQNREQSGFYDFCRETLFSGPKAPEYKARVDELSQENREIFLYQEFVRFNHAKRIRQWIEGSLSPTLGLAETAVSEVQRILANLDPTLRRDLALVAESHHLDDLDDLTKYKLIQPYGSTDSETANIQYCAILLRAADLLHMRRDRTPSVLFRIINPTDPISQREWAKQNAVRRVMPRLGFNEDGVPDEIAPKDTIEIHATFTEENGFFGLTSFVAYAAQELRKCHDWAEASRKTKGSKYSFVWRRIAEDQIETEGFLRKTYSFDLDQYKILDLLIGHTLYNDTGVVLRELSQNGLDAIRLQEEEDRKKGLSITPGYLQVAWDSKTRVLTITDNGTGMTQDIIEKHLLKVGSSRYQDQKFKDAHPTFSAISRFGIGVLSTFMVSDEVEITTCSADEEKARKISLRSVHGRYLVRLLDKTRDQEALALSPHGTQVRLKVRSTANLGAVIDLMRRWIVIPRCTVTVTVDGREPVAIGYKSATNAIESFLVEAGLGTGSDSSEYKVFTRKADGIEFAYAARWSSYYKDWSIAGSRRKSTNPIPCTCVEGVAVVFSTPGLVGESLIAIANATGPNAPKTNVARSTLEATPERDALYSTVYELYIDHVKDEITRLTQVENYSLTWAANNAINLVPFDFRGSENEAVLPGKLREHMKSLPVYIVEKSGKRINIDFNGLAKEKIFWTVDSQLMKSAERLVREAKSNSTVSDIVVALGDPAQKLPSGTILYNLDVSVTLRDAVEFEFEPKELAASENLRRIDIQWAERNSERWIRVGELIMRITRNRPSQRLRISEHLQDYMSRQGRRRSSFDMMSVTRLWLASPQVSFRGLDRYAGIISHRSTFLRGDIPITEYLRKVSSEAEAQNSEHRLEVFASVFLATLDNPQDKIVTFASTQLRHLEGDLGEEHTKGKDEFLEALRSSPTTCFDTSVWSDRRFDLFDY